MEIRKCLNCNKTWKENTPGFDNCLDPARVRVWKASIETGDRCIICRGVETQQLPKHFCKQIDRAVGLLPTVQRAALKTVLFVKDTCIDRIPKKIYPRSWKTSSPRASAKVLKFLQARIQLGISPETTGKTYFLEPFPYSNRWPPSETGDRIKRIRYGLPL